MEKKNLKTKSKKKLQKGQNNILFIFSLKLQRSQPQKMATSSKKKLTSSENYTQKVDATFSEHMRHTGLELPDGISLSIRL